MKLFEHGYSKVDMLLKNTLSDLKLGSIKNGPRQTW